MMMMMMMVDSTLVDPATVASNALKKLPEEQVLPSSEMTVARHLVAYVYVLVAIKHSPICATDVFISGA